MENLYNGMFNVSIVDVNEDTDITNGYLEVYIDEDNGNWYIDLWSNEDLVCCQGENVKIKELDDNEYLITGDEDISIILTKEELEEYFVLY